MEVTSEGACSHMQQLCNFFAYLLGFILFIVALRFLEGVLSYHGIIVNHVFWLLLNMNVLMSKFYELLDIVTLPRVGDLVQGGLAPAVQEIKVEFRM